jgi:ADP-heptose:LPS heptosyltransferase
MMKRIKFIKLLDALMGPWLVKLFPGPVKKFSRQAVFKKILVIRPGGMGDALLLLPVLKYIATRFKVRIDILCEPRNQQIFLSAPFVHEIFSYQEIRSLIKLCTKQYNAVFDTEQSHFLSAVFSGLTRADFRIGFKTCSRQKIYHKTCEYDHKTYEAEMFWQLFTLTYPMEPHFRFDLPYFNPGLDCVFKNKLSILDHKKFICLFPGATINERHWPEDRWAGVIDWIDKKNIIPVLIGGSKEKNMCRNIMAMCRAKKTINLCARLSIAETVQLFAKACILISTDSGILHLGVVCGIPTISLFGPGIMEKWAPRGKNHIVINAKVSCSPCTRFGTTAPCPNNNECMKKITPDMIINALREHGIS